MGPVWIQSGRLQKKHRPQPHYITRKNHIAKNQLIRLVICYVFNPDFVGIKIVSILQHVDIVGMCLQLILAIFIHLHFSSFVSWNQYVHADIKTRYPIFSAYSKNSRKLFSAVFFAHPATILFRSYTTMDTQTQSA